MRSELIVLLVLLIWTHGIAAQSSGSESSTISGRVVKAREGTPLRFAAVSVESSDGRVHRSATTDSEGQFELARLRAGRYSVRATAPGFVSPLDRSDWRGSYPINLREGEVLDKILVRLPRGAVVTGRVVDSEGLPLDGVPVHALTSERHYGQELVRPASGRRRVTDDRGRFRLFGLQPGSYYLAAQPGPLGDDSGGPFPGFVTTYYPGSEAANEAQLLTVLAEQELEIGDLSVRSSSTSSVTGTVFGSSGLPARGVELSLRPRNGQVSFPMARTVSGASGEFSFPNVSRGLSVLQNVPTASLPEFGSMVLSVGPGVSIAPLHLRRANLLNGVVTFEGGSPDFTSRDLQFVLRPVDVNQSPLGRGASVQMHEDWRLEIANMWGPHFLRLLVTPRGWMLKAIQVGSADYVTKPIESSLSGELKVFLTNQVSTISGTVLDDRGDAASGGVVLMFSTEAESWYSDARSVQHVAIGPQGEFDSGALPTGDYLVIAVESLNLNDWPPRAEALELLRPLATRIPISTPGNHSVRLRLVTSSPR